MAITTPSPEILHSPGFSPKTIRITVPATTANLGPGFDCLGMALDLPTEFELFESEIGPWHIEYLGPRQPNPMPPLDGTNFVARCIDRIFHLAGRSKPVSLTLRIRLGAPLARGLGSSATAIVGGMMAANEFLGRPLPPEALLAEMVSMEGHPDNVVPCYQGGASSSVVIDGHVHALRIMPAATLKAVVFIPSYSLKTEDARRAIPKTLAHVDACFNLARVPLVLEAIRTGDFNLLQAVVEDRLHEPYRRELVQGFDTIKQTALEAGAAAVMLSGAGPTQIALCSSDQADRIHLAWQSLARAMGAEVRVLSPDCAGARPVASP
jgi:homoserine kinase